MYWDHIACTILYIGQFLLLEVPSIKNQWSDKGACKLGFPGKLIQYFLTLLPKLTSHSPFYQLNLGDSYALTSVIKYYSELINLRMEYIVFSQRRINRNCFLEFRTVHLVLSDQEVPFPSMKKLWQHSRSFLKKICFFYVYL